MLLVCLFGHQPRSGFAGFGCEVKDHVAGWNHQNARKSILVKVHGRAPQGWKGDEQTAALIVDRSSATAGLRLDGQRANHFPRAARYVVVEFGEVREDWIHLTVGFDRDFPVRPI